MKKITSIVLAMVMVLSMMSSFAVAENKLWTEELTADGWMKVTNEGGAILGYSPNSGLKLVEADGYAFKDLNGNGKLDVYEDWRVDYMERARALAEGGELDMNFQMGLKMNPMSIGTISTEEVPEAFQNALKAGYRHLRYNKGNVETSVVWNNMVQEYIESLGGVVIPATFIDDPLSVNVSKWPSNLGLAATFDPELVGEFARTHGDEYRALGVTMQVGPQIDLATEPRWKRITGTFGEDPQLAIDMVKELINGFQSTYDAEGNDIGWGVDSVNTQIKHLWGEGAAEGGREAHTPDGAYNVYPGEQWATHLMVYAAALDLPGLTKESSSAMTNFSIAVDAYGDAIGGDRYAGSFSEWKLQEMWREAFSWDGYILNDFNTHYDKPFGVEHMSTEERFLQMMIAGVDAFGAFGRTPDSDIAIAVEAYNVGVEKYGKEIMDKYMVDSTRHIVQVLFNVGVVDNPYLSLEESKATVNKAEYAAAGVEAQKKSIVMVKNTDGLIKAAGEEKKTVYIPMVYKPESQGRNGVTPASWAACIDVKTASQYFNVVTDKIGPKTGTGSDGKAAWTENDIVRASAEEIAACDFAIVMISSPATSNATKAYVENNPEAMYAYNGNTKANPNPPEYTYKPISLQYRPYTADNMYVRFESIGGDITQYEVEGVYGPEVVYEKENRAYFGESTTSTNESDLDLVLNTAALCDKVVVFVNASKPMVFSEFESEVDAILMGWGLSDASIYLQAAAGIYEPSGLLPMQMPASMETVEAQYEDVPRDMECHVDADGNTYDFAFGLNWSGVINDERVAKYAVDPISAADLADVKAFFGME